MKELQSNLKYKKNIVTVSVFFLIFSVFTAYSQKDEFDNQYLIKNQTNNSSNKFKNISAHDRFNTYQWRGGEKPWFEWWYYKFNIPGTDDAFCIIYGIVNPGDSTGKYPWSRAYTEVVNFRSGEIFSSVTDIKDFNASKQESFIQIGTNTAKTDLIEGNIVNKNGDSVSWEIHIQNSWSFNAMGWGMYIPTATNIFWYPAQASALFTGIIRFGGNTYNFQNCPGYQDKNWGRSFPAWWTWIVSNHFRGNPNTAIVVGGGRPKILNIRDPIEGVSIGLKHKDKIYSFRPNDADNMNLDVRFGNWEIEAWNMKNKIRIRAWAPAEKFIDLMFTTPDGKIFHDLETLNGELKVELYERKWGKKKWHLVDTLYSDQAGIEYGTTNIENTHYSNEHLNR